VKHVLAVVSVLALVGCGSEVDQTCDRAALDAIDTQAGPDQAASAVLAACPSLPEGVARALRGEVVAEAELPPKVWTCDAVPLEEASKGAAGAVHAYAACGWSPIFGSGWDTTGAGFAWAQGRPVASVLLHHWLVAAGYPDERALDLASAVRGPRAVSEQRPPVALAPTPAFDLTDEATADLVLSPGGLTERGDPVDAERLGQLQGVISVLVPGAEPASSSTTPPAAPLGELVDATTGRVSRIDLIGRVEDRLVAVPVVPVSAHPGPALAGAVEVHVHQGGLLLRHGAAQRTTESVTQAELAERVAELMGQDVPGRTLRLVPHDAPVPAIARAAQALAGVGTVHLTPGDRACGNAPSGMICVQGGSQEVAGGHRVIRPFLIDVTPASFADYEACVQKGGCRRDERRGNGPQVLSDLTWDEAQRYCVHVGKALPSEWQWEHAARAGVLQSASEGPSEWTRSAYLPEPGEHAQGIDPIGPCDGAPDCQAAQPTAHRVLRGGEGAEPSTRAHADPDAATHGVRCVRPWPPVPPPGEPELAPLEPPDQRLLDLFHGSPEDPIEQKPLCDGVGGQAHLHCRDPVTYIIGNEPRADLFVPYLQDLGGGYIGVAADQNYSQAAVAGTRWLWLMDYDPKVVSVHRMNGVFIKASATPAEFVDWYKPSRRVEAQAFVEKELGDDELTQLALRNLRVWGDRLYDYYTAGMAPPRAKEGIDGKWVPAGRPDFGWLRNAEHYRHIRTLWQQGRVRAVKGDMLGDEAMQGIGRAAREMGVPIRVYYTSNAPYAWGGMMRPSYRRNVRSLPMDQHSIVVQTLGSPSGYGQETYWHHSVVRGPLAQERLGLPGYDHVSKIVVDRAYGGDPDLTVLGLLERGGEE